MKTIQHIIKKFENNEYSIRDVSDAFLDTVDCFDNKELNLIHAAIETIYANSVDERRQINSPERDLVLGFLRDADAILNTVSD